MGVALNIIEKLEVKEFDWKHDGKHDIGLIAEEVNEIFPEAVLRDKDNNIIGLKPLTLIGLLVKAMKEIKGG